MKEVKARASARGEHFDFSANQLRSKFKKCVSLCKQAALTQKSATGIKRFQEDQGLGTWFTTLFEVVKTRESCQPKFAGKNNFAQYMSIESCPSLIVS